jgi:hypothetical protein
MNPEVEKTASLIPEFYFDLIARIIPGVIFYACITYAWQGSSYKPGQGKRKKNTGKLCCGYGARPAARTVSM